MFVFIHIAQHFNPRSREGSDVFRKRHSIVHILISIHAPARGATNPHEINLQSSFDFNPRSREGSDADVLFCVSILETISIHAPARGATAKSVGSLKAVVISIHAPARGATLFTNSFQISTFDFNPRSREGSDKRERLITDEVQAFQSTLPRGERRRFNDDVKSSLVISIHAPARGATIKLLPSEANTIISIHAPARGATEVEITKARPVAISIHAPARGATFTSVYGA